MAWKKYSEMSPEEKKASWAKFSSRSKAKALQTKRDNAEASRPHPNNGHKYDPNPGGYCRHCSYGRDYS